MNNNKKMNIFLSSDDNFAPYLGVTITSILVNSDSEDEFRFFILDGGISRNNKTKIESLKKLKNFDIEFIDLYKDNVEFKHASFYRMKIASLKPDLDKAIYLDCDLLVKTSLKPFWDEDLSAYFAGVVEEPWLSKSILKKKLNIDNYFNSGVMLINMKKWREENIEDAFFAYINNPDSIIKGGMLSYGDQNVLNSVLNNKVKYLHLRWNMVMCIFNANTDYSKPNEINEALENPGIIHLTTQNKPWMTFRHIHKQEFYKYVLKSPWKYNIIKTNFFACIKRVLVKLHLTEVKY